MSKKVKSMSFAVAGLALSCVTAFTAFSAQAAEPKELFFYNWTDYYPVDLLAKFEKETGIKVTMDGYDSNETLLAKLQAGGAAYDVIVPSQSIMRTLINQDLLLEIDASALPNFQYVKPAFRDPSFDPGRNTCGAPPGFPMTAPGCPAASLTTRGKSSSSRARNCKVSSPPSTPPAA